MSWRPGRRKHRNRRWEPYAKTAPARPRPQRRPAFDNFEANARSSMARGVGGMALLIIGGFVRGIGARGLAGSGVVLDPEQARRELEPYSRMAGGMVKDALDEADVKLGGKRI